MQRPKSASSCVRDGRRPKLSFVLSVRECHFGTLNASGGPAVYHFRLSVQNIDGESQRFRAFVCPRKLKKKKARIRYQVTACRRQASVVAPGMTQGLVVEMKLFNVDDDPQELEFTKIRIQEMLEIVTEVGEM